MSADGHAVAEQVRRTLPPPESWTNPTGYRGSLALCVIDSVFSLRAAYSSTVAVVNRYRAARQQAGADPEIDGLGELVAAIDSVGGPRTAAGPALFDNRGYAPGTARRGTEGVLKSEAIYSAATAMRHAGIDSTEDLREQLSSGRAAWLGVRGLGWVSWDYLLMLTGADGVKADTMVQRFVATSVGAPAVSGERAKVAVIDAAALLEVDARVLDHAIWLHQRKQGAAQPESSR